MRTESGIRGHWSAMRARPVPPRREYTAEELAILFAGGDGAAFLRGVLGAEDEPQTQPRYSRHVRFEHGTQRDLLDPASQRVFDKSERLFDEIDAARVRSWERMRAALLQIAGYGSGQDRSAVFASAPAGTAYGPELCDRRIG